MIGAPHPATLQRHPAGPAVTGAIEAALSAVDPGRAVEAVLEGHGATLRIGGRALGSGRRVVLAIGKAAVAMVHPVRARLAGEVTGWVVPKHAPTRDVGLPVTVGGHPVPTDASIAAARAIARCVDGLGPDDTVIVLVSGGASALVCDPLPGVSLEDVRATTAALLSAGADIEALNTVRKHLDGLKGGRLAARAWPATVIALVLSDVPGDPLETIASGPTVGDVTRFSDAIDVLAAAGVVPPPAVAAVLRDGVDGRHPECIRPDDPRLARATTTVIAGNVTATAAAGEALRAAGYEVQAGPWPLHGEAREAGRSLAAALRALPEAARSAIVAGGETVVHVTGDGHGGRNQELALAAVELLAGADDTLFVTCATDGEDGPTDAAGAVVTGDTAARASARGLDPAEHLRRNDAYGFFEGLGDLLRTGPTGTNVCDLAIAVRGPASRVARSDR